MRLIPLFVFPFISLSFLFGFKEFDQNLAYEHVDIVVSNGVSYITLQNVPAGTPITSTAYWKPLLQDAPTDDPGDPPATDDPTSGAPVPGGQPTPLPEFSSSTATVDFTENTTGTVYIASAEGADTYSISGDDASLFQIDESTGVLTFISSPDYENPSDNNTDNNYSIIITATNDTGSDQLLLIVTVTDDTGDNARIVSVSVRGTIGVGNDKRFMGFRLNGTADVLLRGVGPALADFGLPMSDLLPDPTLSLFRYINGDPAQGSERVSIGDNDNYTSNTSDQISAIELVRASNALDIPKNDLQAISMPSLDEGFYTSQVEDVNGQTGIGWTGVDLSYPESTSKSFLHVSTRGLVQTSEYMFAGFQITGVGTRKIFIRGRGPSLTEFGVTGVMPDPIIKVFKYVDVPGSASSLLYENNDYVTNSNATEILSYSTTLYGWPEINEKGAALVLDLQPGYYTVQLISESVANDGNGWIGLDDVTDL